MTDLSQNELRRIDLTLLLVFLGLARFRKAADVAADLGLTQSAISQALRRLREIFRDDLFLRRPHGMEPTATAIALEGPIAKAVEALRTALGVARHFEPESATGVIRIAALDAEQVGLIPALAASIARLAPGVALQILPLGRGAAMDALADGRVDLAFGFVIGPPETIRQEAYFEEGYLVAGRPVSLPDAPVIDLDAYCAAEHVLVSPGGDLTGIVDEQLERLGRSRQVRLSLPAFLPALAAVASSGALVTLPSRIARNFAPAFGLVTAAPPVTLRRFTVSAYWHRRNDADPRLDWLRAQARRIALPLDDGAASGTTGNVSPRQAAGASADQVEPT